MHISFVADENWPQVCTGNVIIFKWLFLQLLVVFFHTYVLIMSCLHLRRTLWRSEELSFYTALPSVVLCPVWHIIAALVSRFSHTISSTSEVCWALPGFPLPEQWPGNSQGSKLGQALGPRHLFLLSQGLLYFIICYHCLQNFYFI